MESIGLWAQLRPSGCEVLHMPTVEGAKQVIAPHSSMSCQFLKNLA